MKQGQGACEQMHCMYTHVQASEAAHRRERLRAKITSSLALQKDAHSLKQQLTVKYFEEIVVPGASEASIVREIKRNQAILSSFYALPRKERVPYTINRVKLKNCQIITLYKGLLRRIEKGDTIKLGQPCNIISSLMKSNHVFRNGELTASAKKIIQREREEIKQLISECQAAAADLKKKTSKQHVGGKKEGNTLAKFDPALIGRRVLLPGSRWDMSGVWYIGSIVKHFTTRKGRGRNSKLGYTFDIY